ncbi:hypothetical protein Pelo_5474 [Pelomyxa schiedti]|nr:hypothetical protein Pelo_5474 [Pelomyxa schiedti]
MEANATNSALQGKVNFLSINIDSIDQARTMGAQWSHLKHLFVSGDLKTLLCKHFNLRYIPHCVLIDKNKIVLNNYDDFRSTDVAKIQAAL